jgi:TadE-like protein
MLSTKVKRSRMEKVVTRSATYANFVRKTRLKSWRMLHRLKGDRRGTTAVEFALTANAFLLLVFLLFETAWMMTIEMAMNDAAQEASRLGSLGTLPATGSREDAIKDAIVTRAAGLLASANLTSRCRAMAALTATGIMLPMRPKLLAQAQAGSWCSTWSLTRSRC